MSKTALTVKEDQETALALANAFEEDAGAGFEDTDQSDYAIPFLSILQAMSPQCTIGKPQYDENLRPGMFFNSVTSKHYSGKEGVLFVPSKYLRVGNLWVPGKNDGTGFRGQIDVTQMEALLPNCTRDDNNRDITPDGLQLVDTRQWYGLLLEKEEDGSYRAEPMLMSLTSTQSKKSKRWLSLAQGLRHKGKPVPLFSQMYKLTTVPESNDKGSWMGLEIKHAGSVPSMDVYQAAKDFRDMVNSGAAKPAQPEGGESEVPF